MCAEKIPYAEEYYKSKD